MGIIYKYSSVNMYFPSVSEIPTTFNDSNMRILVSLLDIRIILTLFGCLLTERTIVPVSENESYLCKNVNYIYLGNKGGELKKILHKIKHLVVYILNFYYLFFTSEKKLINVNNK